MGQNLYADSASATYGTARGGRSPLSACAPQVSMIAAARARQLLDVRKGDDSLRRRHARVDGVDAAEACIRRHPGLGVVLQPDLPPLPRPPRAAVPVESRRAAGEGIVQMAGVARAVPPIPRPSLRLPPSPSPPPGL
eukprot:6174972-Pleurochrysis_carterae.AAC.2